MTSGPRAADNGWSVFHVSDAASHTAVRLFTSCRCPLSRHWLPDCRDSVVCGELRQRWHLRNLLSIRRLLFRARVPNGASNLPASVRLPSHKIEELSAVALHVGVRILQVARYAPRAIRL